MKHWSVVPYSVWQHTSGKRASIHGAVPYVNEAQKAEWSVVNAGYTLYNSHFNTYGCGRPPSKTHAEAQAMADSFNNR